MTSETLRDFVRVVKEVPWQAEDRLFIGSVNTHSSYSGSMWRGHFLNDVMQAVAGHLQATQMVPDVPSDVWNEYRKAEAAVLHSGRKLVY